MRNLRKIWIDNWGNENLIIDAYPEGYELYTHERVKGQDDGRMWGHPSGGCFKSVPEFYQHCFYLAARSAMEEKGRGDEVGPEFCQCELCIMAERKRQAEVAEKQRKTNLQKNEDGEKKEAGK